MENEVVLNEAVNEEVEVSEAVEESKGNGLKKAGLIALGVVGVVATVKFATQATGTCSIAPVDNLATVLVNPTERSLGIIIPSTPTQLALRKQKTKNPKLHT